MLNEARSFVVQALAAATILSIATSTAFGRGFDDKYTATGVDANGDGRMDIFVSRPSAVTLLSLDDLIIPISARDVADFVLLNNGDGSFRIERPGPGLAGRAGSQGVVLQDDMGDGTTTGIRDVDKDGLLDFELSSLASDIPGAMDLIVYGQLQGKVPTQLTTITPKVQAFTTDLVGQIVDPGYVEARTIPRQAGTQIATRRWFGFASNNIPIAEQYRGLKQLVDTCNQALGQLSTEFCGVSTAPPSPCVRQVDLLDENLNPVGSNLVDVCQFQNHVYIFERLNTTFVTDSSAVDADARAAYQALQVFDRLGCPAVNPEVDDAVGRIVDKIYGGLVGRTVSRFITSNNGGGNVIHPSYPGDELLAENDRTFHHYDVDTTVCQQTEPGCTKSELDNLLRKYSYPSFRLQANLTRVDNEQTLFVFGPLGSTSNARDYVVPGGPIRQEFLTTSGFHQGAVRNRTIFPHPFFPGFISRKIFVQPDGLHVFTHGIGLNRLFRGPEPNLGCVDLPREQTNGLNILLGFLNDFIGPKVFKQLDREMAKAYRRSISGGAAAQFVEEEVMFAGQASILE
jgi:hypothetical protein